MIKHIQFLLLAALTCLFIPNTFLYSQTFGPAEAGSTLGSKYELRYKVDPNEKLAWEVLSKVSFDMTVNGETKRASTYSKSIKLWDVQEVAEDGKFSLFNLVDKVDMWRETSGKARETYNSETDKVAPAGFEEFSLSLGKPLSKMTFDPHGKLIEKVQKHQGKAYGEASQKEQITLPLPKEAIPVGHVWTFPYDFLLYLEGGAQKPIRARNRFQLVEVTGNIATITIENQILTPIRDPAIQSKLVQYRGRGTVKFDIQRGRILYTRVDINESVVGVRGQGSRLQFSSRYVERLVPASVMTASRPK